jgi:hypothetical protein
MTLYEHELKNAYIWEVWTPWANTVWYWTFDDRDASQITDFSWKGNNLTWWTMPTYTQVSWTNYAGNYANVSSWAVPNKSFWTMNEPMTVLVWVMVTATWQKYVSYFWTSSSYYQNSLIYWYNSWQFEYYEDKTYQGTKRVTIKSWVSLNTWYLIWYTRNWTSVTTYCNWVAWWTTTWHSDTSNKTFYLWNSNAWWSERFWGKIWECIVENKVRTDEEVSDYYNQTKFNYWL